jgi:hypothetical protein
MKLEKASVGYITVFLAFGRYYTLSSVGAPPTGDILCLFPPQEFRDTIMEQVTNLIPNDFHSNVYNNRHNDKYILQLIKSVNLLTNQPRHPGSKRSITVRSSKQLKVLVISVVKTAKKRNDSKDF